MKIYLDVEKPPNLVLFLSIMFLRPPPSPPALGLGLRPKPSGLYKGAQILQVSVREQGSVREQSDPVIVLEQIYGLSSGLSLGVELQVCCWLSETCLVRLIKFKKILFPCILLENFLSIN